MSEQQTAERVPFPVPDFDGITATLGASGSAYLTREQMGDDFYLGRTPHTKVASALFHRGGKLADFGQTFKEGIDQQAAMRALSGLLRSFEPKHEIKIGTVGYALREWCDGEPRDFRQ